MKVRPEVHSTYKITLTEDEANALVGLLAAHSFTKLHGRVHTKLESAMADWSR